MPPTIMAVAMSRNTSVALAVCHSINAGKIWLRIKAYMKTKMGRVLTIVDTKDTGPFSIAQKDSTAELSANTSLKISMAITEPRCPISRSSLKTLGRIDNSRKKKDIQNALSQYMFQKEM